MKKYPVLIEDQTVEFLIPESTDDISLSQYQVSVSLRTSISRYYERLEEIQLEIEVMEGDLPKERMDDYELEIAEIFLKIQESKFKQIQAILPNNSMLSQIPASHYDSLLEAMNIQDTPVPEIKFVHKPAARIDLDYYFKEFKNPDRETPKKICKKRMESARKGLFVAVPVAEAAFASRIATDRVRAAWKVLPEILQQRMQKDNLDLEKLDQALRSVQDKSIAQRIEDRKQLTLLNTYAGEQNENIWADAHRIISHVVVVVGHTYNYNIAEARAEQMKSLPLSTARNIVLFFLKARLVSTQTTMISSMRHIVSPMPR